MKTKIFIKLISFAICLSMLCALIPTGMVMADAVPTYYIMESFNGYSDGEKPIWANGDASTLDWAAGKEIYTAPSSLSGYQNPTNGVKTVSAGNKALWVGNKNTEGYWGYQHATSLGADKNVKNIVFSTALMGCEKPMDIAMRIGGTSGTALVPFKVIDGVIYANCTTKVGTVNSKKFTTIDVAADFGKMEFKVYINGRDSGQTYKMSVNITGPIKLFSIEPLRVTEEKGMYVDYMYMYSGSKVVKNHPKQDFNPDCPDIPSTVLFKPNYTLVNQNNAQNGTDGNHARRYNSSAFKTVINGTTWTNYGQQDRDIITLGRMDDDNNPYRPNNWITMRKKGAQAVTIQFLATYGVERSRYYSMTMKLSSDELPSQAEVFRLYGYALHNGGFTTVNQVIGSLDNDGNLVTSTGVKLGKVTKGKFLEFTYAIDVLEHKIDVYVENELKAEGIPFDPRIDLLSGLYLTIPATSSKGSLIIDGVMWRRLAKPWSPDGSHKLSVYPEDEFYTEDLDGKFAVQGYMGTYYSKDGKGEIEDTYYFNSDAKDYKNVYVTKSTMANILCVNVNDIEFNENSSVVKYKGKDYDLGVSTVSKEGKVLASFGPFAEKVLGMDVIYYEDMGMVLAGEKLNINPENERQINDGSFKDGLDTTLMGLAKYMHFERPDAEKLKADYYANGNKQHPRVGITKAEIENLKVARQTDETLNEMIKKKIKFADQNLSVIPKFDIDRTIRGLNSVVILPMSNRIEACAIAWWMTGEQKYVDCAWNQFAEISTWIDWNECHEIDMGRILAAMGYLYDWFYDAWTPDQRAKIIEATERLAVLPTLNHVTYEAGHGVQWAYELSNFNAMCSGGSMVWLAATAGECSDITWELGATAGIRGGEYFLQSHMPDGTTGDSPSYWKEDMFYAMGVLSLDQTFGTTYGIKESPGLIKTSDWIISMEHPAGINPIHDTPGYTTVGDHFATQALGIYAELYNNPDWYAYRAYAQKNANFDDVYSYDIVCYTPGGSMDTVALDNYAEGFQTFSAKGSTTDPTSLFLSAHGGKVRGFHYHEDVGTFVYLNNGVGWATEIRTEDYFVRSAVNSSAKIPMYYDRVESHNCMMFNPTVERMKKASGMTNNQKSVGAEVLDYQSKDRGAFIQYDMSEVYSNDVSKYHRGIMAADDRRTAVIRDEFTVKAEVTEGWWFMNTTADDFEVIDKNTIKMIDDATMEEQIFKLYTDLEDYEIMVIEAKTMWDELNVQDTDETRNFERVAIKFKAKKGSTHYIHVKMYNPDEPGMAEKDSYNVPMTKWTIPDGKLPKREVFDFASYVTDDGLSFSSIIKTITYLEGTKRPEIVKVNLIDESMTYDLIKSDNKVTVRIYSANDKSVFADKTIYYEYGEPVRTLDMYPDGTFTEHTIVNATEEATHSTAVSIGDIYDNSYSSRWGAANIGDYAVLDLGETKEITHFASAQWEGEARTFYYQVLVSNDGVNFTPVKDVITGPFDGIDGTMQIWEIKPVKARYVKILNTGGNTQTKAQNIYEFKLFKKN